MWALVLLLGIAVAQDTGIEPAAEAPERACPVPDVVRVGAYLNDLQELDVKAHSYEFDGYVWFKWCNPDLDPVTTIQFINPSALWGLTITPDYEVPDTLPDGSLYQLARVQGRFSTKMPLYNYPFDRQLIGPIFEDSIHNVHRLVYALDDPGEVTVNPRLKLPGYLIGTPRLEFSQESYPTPFGDPRVDEIPVFSRVQVLVPPRTRAVPGSAGSSHQFIDRGPDKVGYFLEVAPQQPMLSSNAAIAFGADMVGLMGSLKHLSGVIAVHLDGLLPADEGGVVSLRPEGRPRVDYAVAPHLVESFRDAAKNIARLHLAAGATEVRSSHHIPVFVRSEADLGLLDGAPYGAHQHPIFTAHQMGGCPMGPDPATSVVGKDLRVHGTDNLFVVDGSALPTALGVNPSETIYGLAHWARDAVAAAV